MTTLTKTLDIMRVKGYYTTKTALAQVEITVKDADTDKPKLSISGDVWNSRHTDIIMGGQCQDEFMKILDQNEAIHRPISARRKNKIS